jgi:hypothetical protein
MDSHAGDPPTAQQEIRIPSRRNFDKEIPDQSRADFVLIYHAAQPR